MASAPHIFKRLHRAGKYFARPYSAWVAAFTALLIVSISEPMVPALLQPLLDKGFKQLSHLDGARGLDWLVQRARRQHVHRECSDRQSHPPGFAEVAHGHVRPVTRRRFEIVSATKCQRLGKHLGLRSAKRCPIAGEFLHGFVS